MLKFILGFLMGSNIAILLYSLIIASKESDNVLKYGGADNDN